MTHRMERLLCSLGFHGSPRSQGVVGYCPRNCGNLKRIHMGSAYWTRYVEKPTGEPPQGVSPRRGVIVANERNSVRPSLEPFFVVPAGFSPRRRDEVAEWLRSERDDYPRGSTAWCTIDKLLDNYREKADYGLRLDEPGGDP